VLHDQDDDEAVAGVFGFLLHDNLVLLVIVINSGQFQGSVPGLTALQRVLYFQHIFVEDDGLLVFPI